MNKPIIILGMPRGGTSMTAGLFHLHGVWVGRVIKPHKLNAKGFFENQDFKEEFLRRFGRIAQSGEVATPQPDWSEVVRALGPEEGAWLVKHTAMYWPVWVGHQGQFICVRRSEDLVVRSGLKTGFYDTRDEDRVRWLVRRHNEEMNQVAREYDGIDILTDDLIRGDYTTLKTAFDACGIEMDEQKVNDFIEPKLWGNT